MATANTVAPEAVVAQIEKRSGAWKELSISTGYASHREHPEKEIHGLEILADQMMYREKRRYYSTPGHDRRGRE